MHYNCLIVDDEIELAKMTAEYFEMFDIKTQYVDSVSSCYEFLDKNEADLILLDINLGDGSGFDVCKTVREKYKLPILFISARQSDDDVLIALSIGGDDYIKKPYSLAVLLAKVKINLKKIEELKKISAGGDGSVSGTGGQDVPTAGGDSTVDAASASGKRFTIEDATMSVVVDGRHISLKAKEFALLKCLYSHKNTIVTKDALFEEVWGDTFYSDGTLNVHIRKLREKLEEDPNDPKIIKTIWGTGYILEEPSE